MLSSLSVELVILPTQYLADAEFRKTILDYWKADIRNYTLYHDRPNSYIAQIRALVEEYYEEKKYI